MKSYSGYVTIALLLLVALFVFDRCGDKRPSEVVREVDTLWVPYQLPPIEITGKTKTKIISRIDTVPDEDITDMVYTLLDERDSLHSELAKYIREEIQIDTIAGLDTISFYMDYYTLVWRLDIKRGHIDVPHIIETVEKYYDNRNDKYYGAGIGYVLGILTVVAILLGV